MTITRLYHTPRISLSYYSLAIRSFEIDFTGVQAAGVSYKKFIYEGRPEFAELQELGQHYRELGCWKRKVPSDLY